MHYRLGIHCLRNSPAEKNLDILVDVKQNMNQQCILILKKANHALEFLRVSVASGFEKIFLYLELVKTRIDCCVQVQLSASRTILNSWRRSERYYYLGYTCPMSRG